MKVFDGKKVPIKSWCNEPEEGAIEQARNLAALPFVFKHIALMPDTHQGYGMPIGGVIACENVVIPNAVGVDIGCTDGETEFLSPTGWVKISQYSGELVMQFDPETGVSKFVVPINYIKTPCNEFIHFKTKYGINQVLSAEHRCLVYKYDRSGQYNKYTVATAEDIYNKHSKLSNGYRHRFLTSFKPDIHTSINLSDSELRVMVMSCADGHIDKKRMFLRLKKSRKIERCQELLTNAHIEFNHTIGEDGVSTFSFIPPVLRKGLDQFWKASYKQLEIIANEVLYWDGNISDRCFYTRNKTEADFVQYVFSSIGYRGVLRSDIHYRDGKLDYRVYKTDNTKVGINSTSKQHNATRITQPNSYKYCFTVPSSYLVLRREGCIFITGNCGMSAVQTNLIDMDPIMLKAILSGIRSVVPVGFNHHKIEQHWDGFTNIPMQKVIHNEVNSAKKQLGTLGGGNHFIEVQKGSDGFIWIMLHSGSRNFGLKIAQHYNKLAQEFCTLWHSSVPHKGNDGLAFLPVSTKEGMGYITAMNYALNFAYRNRELMMDRVKESFSSIITGCEFTKEINIHHNYAALENHFGKNVWVHRKGATSAKEGQLGIIPGSQGTASYIVKGKGNRESFMSCSHGAGRKMSRKKAREELNLEEEKAKMEELGILHSLRHKKDLDEASSAYKDIDVVMEEQKDLVDIEVELKPLAVIKG